MSMNDPKASKFLENEKINMCCRHFHESNVKTCDENNLAIKLNAVPALHLTKNKLKR